MDGTGTNNTHVSREDRKMLMAYSLTGYVYRNRFQKDQYIKTLA